MKNSIFYYSEKKLKYIEIKNFYPKFVSLVALFSIIFGLIFLFGYIFINDIVNGDSNISKLRAENENLKEKFVEMSSQISTLSDQIDELNVKDNALRLSVNLEPLDESEKNFGIGGYEFKDLQISSLTDIQDIVENIRIPRGAGEASGH